MVDEISLVPLYEENDVYLVLDEIPPSGRVWRELGEDQANEETLLNLIADGKFQRPTRVIVFNTAEGWSHDDTVHFGFKLLEMSREGRALGAAARELVERTTAQVPTLLA